MNKKIFLYTFIFIFSLLGYAEESIDSKNTQSEVKRENSETLNQEESEVFRQGFSLRERIFGKRNPASARKIKRARIKRDKRFKVLGSKTPLKKRKKISLRDIQPPPSTKLYYQRGSDEAELEAVINEEIDQLFKLLKRDRNAELTLRLGSLYVEKARLISFKIQVDYDKHLQEFKSGQRPTKPLLNLKTAQSYNRKSLKLFKDFRSRYPKHRRMDEVLFFLGFNFYQLENEKEGIKYFSELEKRFPKSPYLYESRFQLGEHYFQLGQWKSSYKYYKKISGNKRGKFYFFALYKMAWSSYKMGRVSHGLNILERIIRESRKFKVISDRNQVFTFKDEAIQDLVLFYTYSNRAPEQARSFFLNLLDGKTAWPLLKKLAYTYRDIGHKKGVLILFEDIIKNNPIGEEASEYKYQIVETMYNFGKTSEIIKSLDEWVKKYGPKSSWAQANRGKRTLVKKSLNLQEVTVRNYALKNHETFRRTKRNRAKRLALSCYGIYFNNFTKFDFLDQMRFFYAELLFDSNKYIPAVQSYEEIITRFPKSKYAKAAYINQILALEKTLPTDKEIQKLVGTGDKPVAFTKPIKSFVKAAERYISQFPREKNTSTILYQIAGFYYKFNQFTKSAEYFKKLSNEYPQYKLASNVGSILLDIYNKNQDYKSLEELALKLSQNKNMNKELLREVQSVLEQISFKKAQDLALKKQYKASAGLYEKFARANPSSSLAPSAFYNAGLNFEKDKDQLKALAMYSAVLTYRGKQHEKIHKNSKQFLPLLYEKLGFYKKAADAYVSFAKSYPSDSKAADFWYNAGVIFDALNQTASAVYSYQQHFALSKKQERHEIFYLIGLMHEKNRRWKKAVDSYSQYLKSSSSNKLRLVKASFTIADIYENKFRNSVKARIWHEKTLGLYRRLRSGVSYGSRSHFYITQDLYKRFSQVKIPASSKQQSIAVEKKIKLLKNLKKALRPIIRYDEGEQIISALTLIGKANQEMAQAIYWAPIPKGLNKQGVVQYKEGIKKIIEPYIKEAVKSYQLALKKSENLKIYTEWAKQAYKGLHSIELRRGKFHSFVSPPVLQEAVSLQIMDNTGTVTYNVISTLANSLKYGVSKSDFENLSKAIAAKRESDVLKAVSVILNKDSNNILAINSLAFFYLKSNKQGLGALILNRLSSKDFNSPIIMNNLAMVSLKYGDSREAVSYLKKALAADSFYHIAKVNLANILIQQYNYKAAYNLYRRSYNSLIKNWPEKDKRTVAILNNYGVALALAGEWGSATSIFKKISRGSNPQAEVLLNYAILLAEKEEEDRGDALESLFSAKGLVDELSLYSGSASLKLKVRLLSKLISEKIKELNSVSQKQKRKK